jgi:hypothetical protein
MWPGALPALLTSEEVGAQYGQHRGLLQQQLDAVKAGDVLPRGDCNGSRGGVKTQQAADSSWEAAAGAWSQRAARRI